MMKNEKYFFAGLFLYFQEKTSNATSLFFTKSKN